MYEHQYDLNPKGIIKYMNIFTTSNMFDFIKF
jgi:hypothetical protein